jgi:hypothetical protein
VHAAALARQLGVGATEERVVGPEIDGEELLRCRPKAARSS